MFKRLAKNPPPAQPSGPRPVLPVRVVGKGAGKRLVYLDNGAIEALADYMEARGQSRGAFLWPARKGGRLNEGAGMSDEVAAVILTSCALRAGVGKLSPQDLRRSFVSELLDSGVDIATVEVMAGHSQVPAARTDIGCSLVITFRTRCARYRYDRR